MHSPFISIKDAAQLIGVSEASYRRGMAKGHLPKGRKIGHLRKIRPEAVLKAVGKLEVENKIRLSDLQILKYRRFEAH